MDAQSWDDRYRSREQLFSGDPNGVLVTEVTGLPPGRALDVGCGEGADALWLARHGWQVTATDISTTALQRAAAADTEGHVAWTHADLTTAPPEAGAFDLVCAQYFPLRYQPNHTAPRGLCDAVAPGGYSCLSATTAPTSPLDRKRGSTPTPTTNQTTSPSCSTMTGPFRSTKPAYEPPAPPLARTTPTTPCYEPNADADAAGRIALTIRAAIFEYQCSGVMWIRSDPWDERPTTVSCALLTSRNPRCRAHVEGSPM